MDSHRPRTVAEFRHCLMLIPDLKPRAESLGRSQVLDSVADSLSRCRKPTVVPAAFLRLLRQKQFGEGCSR